MIGKSKFNAALVISCVAFAPENVIPFVPAVIVMPLPSVKFPYIALLLLFNVLEQPVKSTFLNVPCKNIVLPTSPNLMFKLTEFDSEPPAVEP